MFTNIILFQNSFDLSSYGNATISSILYAQACDQIVIVAKLQQMKNGSWTTIKTWSSDSIGTSAALSGSFFVQNLHSYRVVTTGTVYMSGAQIEKTTNTSKVKSY